MGSTRLPRFGGLDVIDAVPHLLSAAGHVSGLILSKPRVSDVYRTVHRPRIRNSGITFRWGSHGVQFNYPVN
jgi:hypothetical protein